MAKTGPKKPNRKPIKKAADKKKAAKLREEGKTFRAIGDEIGISYRQVWNDLKEVENELLAEAKESVKNQRENVLAKLRNVQIEAFGAWKKSLLDKERNTEKLTENGLETSRTVENQTGNAQHLSNLMKSISEEAKLLGLYIPEQAEDNNAADLVKGLADMVKQAGQEHDNSG